jgi:hypothetical protein
VDIPALLFDVLEAAQRNGLLGAAPIADHVSHADGFVEAGGDGAFDDAVVLDLGSGAGIPGLVVAARCPSARLTLLDGRTQRAEFLRAAVARLAWESRVTVIGSRAELAGRDPAFRAAFDIVVARGFAPPAVTAECAAPFLHQGGRLIVSEPPDAASTPSRWNIEVCARLGLGAPTIEQAPRSYAVLLQEALCPELYPRRVGIPSKRPLF